MVTRRERRLLLGLEVLRAVALCRGVEHGIEQDQRVGRRAKCRVLDRFVAVNDHRGAGREVTARGTARGDDPIGIDAPLSGVGAHPADGGPGVLHALERRGLVAALHPIVGGKGHHPLIG